MFKRIVNFFLRILIVYPGQWTISAILKTCTIQVKGLEGFLEAASNKKLIIMLWHNRLALVPSILSRYAPHFTYAAFVSNSRDAGLLRDVVRSYKQARVIRVPHNAKHQALKEMISSLEKQEIVIITPDGPRGPRYTLKPGVLIAAQSAHATVIPLSWSSNKFWELPTWDLLRFPKPFSKIEVSFEHSLDFSEQEYSLEDLKSMLPID